MHRLSIIIGIALLFSGAIALGQGWHGPEKRPFERIERFKEVRLIETLDLKEEQAVRFFTRMKDFEKRRHELQKAKGEALDKIEQAIKDGADDKTLEKLFPDVPAADMRIGEERAKFFNSLSDILTLQQRGKLLLFERNFERDLRDAIRETQQRRVKTEDPKP
jgi:Spy/CpxP family protein refolding chaperone